MTARFDNGVLELCALSMLDQDINGCGTASKASENNADVTDSSIYPMLRKLRQEEYVSYRVEEVRGGPRRKMYSITGKGERYLRELMNKYFRDGCQILEYN